MPKIFDKWAQKLKDVDKGWSRHSELPILDTPRKFTLTPSSSVVSLPAGTDHSIPTKKDFFERFPPEVRRKILIEAFGDKVVHMHLTCGELGRPVGKKNPHWRRRPHAQPRRWKKNEYNWWSCVCHRMGQYSISNRDLAPPVEDECEQGDDTFCDIWPGEPDTKCFIGVMGWLLSCRQAYREGIDVLYATNTIHMSSIELILNLPRLLLTQRLSSITSVEMRWSLGSSADNFPGLHELSNAMPAILPHLELLYISLEGTLRRGAYYTLDVDDSALFGPVEQMISKFTDLKRCEIAVPLSYYDPRRYIERGGWLEPGWLNSRDHERLWQGLPETQLTEAEGTTLTGYWICLGVRDRGFCDYATSCFGTDLV